MKFNAHPGGVLTKDLIPEESSTLTTMLPSKTLRLEKSEEEGQVRVVVFANEDEAIQGFDLTFTGAYDSGSSGYVVHAIGLPLLPSGSPLVLDDDGPCRWGGGRARGGVEGCNLLGSGCGAEHQDGGISSRHQGWRRSICQHPAPSPPTAQTRAPRLFTPAATHLPCLAPPPQAVQ